MKISIVGRVVLLALLIPITACSFDTILGVKPHREPPVAPASVDSQPVPEVKVPDLQPQGREAAVKPPEPAPTETAGQQQAPPPSPAAVQQEPARVMQQVERIPYADPAPDLVFRNTVLAEDTILRGLVHVTGWLTVPAHVTLAIEAGTVIRFIAEEGGGSAGAGLLVQGRLVASGTPDRQVLFTGAFDKPAQGDWQGIVLLATEKKNLLEQCRFEGADAALNVLHSQVTVRVFAVSSCATAVRLSDSYASFAGGAVSTCGTGIESAASELELYDMNLSSNRKGITAAGGSLHLSGSTFYGNSGTALTAVHARLKVTGCSFTVNGTGLFVEKSEGSVSFNRVLSNREAGLDITDSRVKVNGNMISQNGSTGLRINGGGSVVWGNVIASNNGHDLEYTGDADLAVMGNWWGETSPEFVRARIRTGDSKGRVLFLPVLVQRPPSIL